MVTCAASGYNSSKKENKKNYYILHNFEDAREISPSHRAYTTNLLNCHTVEITFTPSNECIAKVKLNKQTELINRFVFDLRVINAEGTGCCSNENHAEVGRYYICGQYEYCNVIHSPKVVDFGNVAMKSKHTRAIRIRNESNFISAKMSYVKATAFDVIPQKFCIPPNSSKKIEIILNPNSIIIAKVLNFHIRNPHDSTIEPTKSGMEMPDSNFLLYTINVEANVYIGNLKKVPIVESLHKLYELSPWDTYLNEELKIHSERKKLGHQLLLFSKSMHKKKVVKDKFCSAKPECYSDDPHKTKKMLKPGHNFCKDFHSKIRAPDMFSIFLHPQSLDFGKVGFKTYGKQYLTLKNDSKYDITIKFKDDKNILYTNHKLREHTIKLKSQKQITIPILCFGFALGIQEDFFSYIVDNKFNRRVVYKIQIENPVLYIPETILKFGMVTSEGFVSSVPVKIYNDFNIPVDFEWEEINSEVPFEILPNNGTVPMHSCKICDVTYVSKTSKTKSYEINLLSKSNIITHIPIEANIMSRKVTVKFLQQVLIYRDIPLNIDATETIRLENSSREIAVYYVIEPLLPGMQVVPMSGVMRPKSIITFYITMKVCCVLEFFFDFCIRINNKEIIGLPINGNVMEPKLTMSPRNVFMPRIPCGMISYVPVTLHNSGNVKSLVEILDTDDENIFEVFIQEKFDKHKVTNIILKPGQSKTLFVKVHDVFRREYDMYIPFKINGLLGPPNLQESGSTEIGYYIGDYEKLYENYIKVKVKPIHKDINYVRIVGVFTLPWIELSVENFDIIYTPNGENSIEFTMTNISKYYLHICIVTSKLSPHFSLDVITEDNESIINETCIKFELDRARKASFRLNFHPYGLGRISTVATLYLDKAMSLPFHNLSFNGYREIPVMKCSTHRILFPPSYVGTELSQTTTVTLEEESNISAFTCSSKEESNISVELIDCSILKVGDRSHTLIIVKITVCCNTPYARNLSLVFHHECGSTCSIEVSFCFTYCPITLHTNLYVKPEENPFPFYPESTQTALYNYLEKSVFFLERWMFQQGFRRDLFPIIPDTFYAIAPTMLGTVKPKGINITLLNFLRKIAGPLIRHIHKASGNYEEPFKAVKDTHDTYKSIINLLRSRGANLWLLQAKFLLTYSQFLIYSDFEPPVYDADVVFTEILKNDEDLFNRLAKQCWFDFILQCYKVFIMDSCFFDCICTSSGPRDIEMILINWYNDQIRVGHHKILKYSPMKNITNITTDLRDGVAIISAIYNHCSFLEELLSFICEVDEKNAVGGIVHNACIIMEAMNLLRLYFPLTSRDFLEPNFLQMLFLSIHLYVILPMFRPKDKIELKPPLLRTSSRTVSINPISSESLVFNFVILNNRKNNFNVERHVAECNEKKMSIIIKYTANFVSQDKAVLLVHGFNKTRIFDTYITFNLIGNVSVLNPYKKCKLSAPIYRPNRVDFTVHSPFSTTSLFNIHVTDVEPIIPMVFEEPPKQGFRFKRLKLTDNEIMLTGHSPESNVDPIEHKIYLYLYCLNTQSESAWMWFRSEIGEFFIKLCTQPRWDMTIDTLLVKVQNWPIDPCSCGEACECYRTTILMIPHRNDLMIKALRYAMVDCTTDVMMKVYDTLIESTTGQIVLLMLLTEGGTKMSELAHILRPETTYRVSSRNLMPRQEYVTLRQHTDAVLTLPITIPPREKSEKFSIMLSSDCGMDIRTYKILFIEEPSLTNSTSSNSTSS